MKNINAIYSLIISNLKKLNVIYNKNNYKKEQSFYTNKSDIIKWLDKYKITHYKLIEDDKYGYIAHVNSDVILIGKRLSFIPIKFGIISGNFDCYTNNLTSLQFCPHTVGGGFNCGFNKLTSLEGCPTTIGGGFSCSHNKLSSLEFCPHTIYGNFLCSNNNLSSLQFCPSTIGSGFYCINNKITNFIHFPSHIGNDIYLRNNNLIGIDMSKCYKFEEICKIHLEHKITAEKELLNNILDANPKKISYCKNNKLKI